MRRFSQSCISLLLLVVSLSLCTAVDVLWSVALYERSFDPMVCWESLVFRRSAVSQLCEIQSRGHPESNIAIRIVADFVSSSM